VRRGLHSGDLRAHVPSDPVLISLGLSRQAIPTRSRSAAEGFLGPHDLHNASRLLFFPPAEAWFETEATRLCVMSAHFFLWLAVRRQTSGLCVLSVPFSLFLWLAVWRPSLLSLGAHAELLG
jgi:hypothetical protein